MTRPFQATPKRILLLAWQWLAMLLAGAGVSIARADAGTNSYAFVYLGDMHFDQVSHHDMAWVRAEKPDDVRLF